jgi:hypothetical protein
MTDDNTREIAEQIFSRPPGEPNSIDLQLDDGTIDFMREEGYEMNNFVKDILSMITLHGVEILFSHRNIMMLSDDDVFLLKKYIRSYGYELKVKRVGAVMIIDFEKYY